MNARRDNTSDSNEIKKRFCETVRKRSYVIRAMRSELSLPPQARPDLSNRRKTDATISEEEIRVDIHSFESGGYNQIDRRDLAIFCQRSGISAEDCEFVRMLVHRKAQSPRGLLVFPEEHDRVRKIFENADVVTPALLGEDKPQFMAIFSREEEKFRIYAMRRQVLPALLQGGIEFTPQGGNIQIGEYLFVQRRGKEDGKQTGSANDIQTKMHIKKFYQIEPLCEFPP